MPPFDKASLRREWQIFLLALGFLKNGRARHGERVRLVDHLRGVETICEVQDPVQFDADGGRMRD